MNCYLCKKPLTQVLTEQVREGKQRVYYCPDCDLGILDDNRTQAELNEYYRGEYRKFHSPELNKENKAEKIFKMNVNFQEERLQLVKPYLNESSKLLEIGCSAGQFLYHLKDYVQKTVGVDMDDSCLAYASQHASFVTNDIHIIAENDFDAICMFQVLEHIKKPYAYILRLKEYLKKDGYIFIEVPNLRDALLYAYNIPAYKKFYFHKAHLFYFTKKSLSNIMKKAGFEGNVYYTQDYNFLNHIHWLQNDKPQNSCIEGLSIAGKYIIKDIPSSYLDMKYQILSTFNKMDAIYKNMLKRLGITSNLFYIGRREDVL